MNPEPRQVQIAAVIFDMDGVLIDSAPVIENAWSEVSRRHGRMVTPMEVRNFIHGRPGSETVRLLFPDHSVEDRKAIWAEVDKLEEESECSAIPGVGSLLADLSRIGVDVGLVTSSWPQRIEFVLKLLDLTDFFKVTVNRTDVSLGKPNPDPYLAGCRKLQVDPARVLVFEDSVAGVRSAVAAGAACVGVGDAGLVEVGAMTTVPDFTGLSISETKTGLASLVGFEAGIVVDLQHAGRPMSDIDS